MSYNGSGTFNINTSGQPVVAGTVITATAFNLLTADLATGLTTAMTKDGQTTTTARIPFAQGISSTLVTDATNTTSGSIITAGGVGIAKALYVGTNANVAGTLDVTGTTTLTNPVINNIKMGYSTTATAAGTTTLTISSNYRQFFTGSTTQTIVLPVTSTLVTGIAYEIENNSTGLLTVNSSGGNLVGTIPAGVCAHAVCIGTTLTTAADWDWDYISTTTITGTGANVLGTSPTITTATLASPNITTALTLTGSAGTSGQALVSAGSGNAPTWSTVSSDTVGFKNRIINGAMVIDQRNAGASVTPTASAYTLDRWYANISQSSKFSVQQNAGSVTTPSGFTNYLGITSLSAYSIGATDYFILQQAIEGFNTADLKWGTAFAQNVTLSFQVYSSLTGTFGGTISSGASQRAYPFTYTISSANTWTTVSVTIAGDTGGTWNGATNGVGVIVRFGLGVGSTYSATAGSWTSTNFIFSATGATSVVGTNGATFYITGVQLEKGSTATSFDYRPYGQEFYLCQRYYQTLPFGSGFFSMGGAIATNNVRGTLLKLDTVMRAAPTVTIPASGSGAGQMFYSTASGGTPSTIGTNSVQRAQVNSFQIEGDGYTGAFVVGQGVGLSAGSGGLTITASSEL
jgi:hypothetical protein